MRYMAAAREFLKRGIHVICDKPLTSTLADARKMAQAAEKSDAVRRGRMKTRHVQVLSQLCCDSSFEAQLLIELPLN